MLSWFCNSDGIETGNGGDAIECSDGKVYSLDYVLTESSKLRVDPQLLKLDSADEILQEIAIRLKKLAPIWGEWLDEMAASRNHDLFDGYSYKWIPGSSRLVEIDDEELLRVPHTCLGERSKLKQKLRQAVVRKVAAGNAILYYDENIFKDLTDNHPVQLSFLLIHEWLRDFLKSPADIATITRVLRSNFGRS